MNAPPKEPLVMDNPGTGIQKQGSSLILGDVGAPRLADLGTWSRKLGLMLEPGRQLSGENLVVTLPPLVCSTHFLWHRPEGRSDEIE